MSDFPTYTTYVRVITASSPEELETRINEALQIPASIVGTPVIDPIRMEYLSVIEYNGEPRVVSSDGSQAGIQMLERATVIEGLLRFGLDNTADQYGVAREKLFSTYLITRSELMNEFGLSSTGTDAPADPEAALAKKLGISDSELKNLVFWREGPK